LVEERVEERRFVEERVEERRFVEERVEERWKSGALAPRQDAPEISGL
jgi:hypothetical protein